MMKKDWAEQYRIEPVLVETFVEKERFKAAAKIQKQSLKTVIVSVGDRESDIYELFEIALEDPKGPKILVRASHNRNLTNEQRHLWEYIGSYPVSGIQQIKIPRKGKHPSREAELDIRYSKVELKPPKRKENKVGIKLWAILAQEKNAPESVTPVEWMLLTTVPVNSFEEAEWKALVAYKTKYPVPP